MNQIDIHTLIDYAMKEKTHTVSIFISGDNTSVRIEPYKDSDPRWIMRDCIKSGRRFPVREFECSECHTWHEKATPYCPDCGEKLRMPIEEDNKKEETTDDSTGKIEE